MEKQPKTTESISPKERQRLHKRTLERADWYRMQLAAAPAEVRERYIPLLTVGSLLEHDELELIEREHLQKIIAIEESVLDTIPDGIGGVSELRQFVEQNADTELAQWRGFIAQGHQAKLPQPWKNAVKDARKLSSAVSQAESAE